MDDRKKNRQFFLVAVHAFLVQKDRVLLCERFNTGYMDGHLSVPAGHVDGKETIWQAMRREIQEEVGVVVETDQHPAHVMHRSRDDEQEERIDYFFVIRNWTGNVRNCEPEKCSRVEWFSQTDLPDTVIPYVRCAWEQIHAGNVFSEFSERR